MSSIEDSLWSISFLEMCRLDPDRWRGCRVDRTGDYFLVTDARGHSVLPFRKGQRLHLLRGGRIRLVTG